MTTPDAQARAQLRKLAMKATQGPWGFARADYNSGNRPWVTQLRDGSADGAPICLMQPPKGPHDLGNQPFSPSHQIYDNARFVAAADPTTILALLDHIDTETRGASQ